MNDTETLIENQPIEYFIKNYLLDTDKFYKNLSSGKSFRKSLTLSSKYGEKIYKYDGKTIYGMYYENQPYANSKFHNIDHIESIFKKFYKQKKKVIFAYELSFKQYECFGVKGTIEYVCNKFSIDKETAYNYYASNFIEDIDQLFYILYKKDPIYKKAIDKKIKNNFEYFDTYYKPINLKPVKINGENIKFYKDVYNSGFTKLFAVTSGSNKKETILSSDKTTLVTKGVKDKIECDYNEVFLKVSQDDLFKETPTSGLLHYFLMNFCDKDLKYYKGKSSLFIKASLLLESD